MNITEEDYDKLVDAEINVDVMLGSNYVTLKEFLSLSEGDIIPLNKLAGAGGDIYVNGRIIGTGEIIVIDDKLAARINEAMDNDTVVSYFFDENLL